MKKNMFKMRSFFYIPLVLMFLFGFSCFEGLAQSEYRVIPNWLSFTDAQNSLYQYLSRQAFDQLNRRAEKLDRLKTPEDWQAWQKGVSETYRKSLGLYPERAPLNARVVKVITKDKYRVEHIVYESIPGYYVTASMFIPSGLKKKDRAPAILFCSGHSDIAYRDDSYQRTILNLVYKGFVVLAFDPVGQGERLQYYDRKLGESLFGPTHEHSYPGSQLLITGNSLSKYMIWDGMRAVDYLLTRREVDPERIGINGRSGGGTQTALIAAADERIYAAAPENYITSFQRLLQEKGPQDAEQVLFRPIYNGLDHADLLIMRAPKPALMVTTSNDIFNIQGSMETEREVEKVYKAYGKTENFSRVEDVAPHASTLKNREALYAFFQKHLRNPGDSKDLDPEHMQMLTPEELRVTESGQVYVSLGGESVFSIANTIKESQVKELEAARIVPRNDIVRSAKILSGYEAPEKAPYPVYTGKAVKEGYTVEKFFTEGEGGYPVPYLLFTPQNPTGEYMIYLNPKGKSDSTFLADELPRFMDAGLTVLSADLVGYGETGPGSFKGDAYIGGYSHNVWYLSMMIGRSVVGIRAADAVSLSQIIRQRDKKAVITGYAKDECTPVLLHAAAFSDNFNKVVLINPCTSYAAIVAEKFYASSFIMNAVPAALTQYDLPDLAVTLSPRPLLIVGAVDGTGQKANVSQIENDLNVIRKGYAADKLKIEDNCSLTSVCNWLSR